MSSSEYLFENAAPEAGDRFDALAALFDPVTIRHFDALGVAEGWRCFELGAGGGSIARWLSKRVGATGHVLATDLDVRWFAQQDHDANLEIRRHNLIDEPLPDEAFDLAHERLVLVHIPERAAALERMVSALRPGGWLLAEDFSSGVVPDWFVNPTNEDEHLANRIVSEMRGLLAQRGADPALGHKLPQLLRDAGLEDVGADAYQVVVQGEPVRRLLHANVGQVAEQLVEERGIARADLDRFLALIARGELNPSSPLLVSAWGRRPLE
ncbi:MAG: methyltransferase domain-containing protein [Acidimicrobiia bacterium]